MIVQCASCQTRFKIADEKVTERGVKVRCTRCKTLFVVRREPEAQKSPPATEKAPTQVARPAPARPAAADPFAAFKTGELRPAVDPFADIGSSRGAAASPFSGQASGSGPKTGPFASPSRPGGAFAQPPVRSSAPVPGFPALDPGVARSNSKPAPQFRAPADDPFAPLPQETANPFGAPAAPQTQPWGTGAAPGDPFADLQLDLRPQDPRSAPPVAQPAPAPAPAPSPSPLLPELGTLDLNAPEYSSTSQPQKDSGGFGMENEPSGLELDTPAAGDQEMKARKELFDLGTPAMPDAKPAGDDDPDTVSRTVVRQIQWPERPGDQLEVAAPTGVRVSPKGRVITGLRVPAPKVRKKRSAASALVNALLLAGIGALALTLVLVNQLKGRMTLAELSFGRAWQVLLRKDVGDLAPAEVGNGLYETQTGRSLFVVRGTIVNRSAQSQGPVKVTAELRRGSSVAQRAEGWAGDLPTPEEVWSVASPTALAELDDRLAARFRPIAPGSAADFAVLFYDYPDEIAEHQLRVVAEVAQLPPKPAKAPAPGGEVAAPDRAAAGGP